ncbi:MFS transporter [Microbacterium sp. 13-71-7]|jgi:CP family cyanate transporter-like MFS transporter|uniref:MFS transporter n=1 Tax=Microbacterium sp. 13-71-7 TaxID=1970399 RepID=UPI000BD4E405|nr:MFS transporter [Microbacterium sp. 13-71-7]OZB86298.1 MAG: MFS transporter [Microbacterium sp. 13-71-7]
MTAGAARPLWQGRTLAVLGIVLCAFSLRSAVASLSPVVDLIGRDFPLSPAIIGLIGTAPPVCFALFGLLTPLFERRLGLERVAVIALSAVTLGLIARGVAVDAVTLVIATALVFAGVGMANILMPPLVKKYFADRMGLMMTVYTTVMAFSTFLPPLVAVPIAETAGWRTSLSMWAVFALAGTIPWIVMLVRDRTGAPRDAAAADPDPEPEDRIREGRDVSLEDAVAVATGPIVVAPSNGRIFARMPRIPLAWALAAVFATSSTMAYASFAWLPTILVQYEGVSAQAAGPLLSLFAFIGLPASLVVPLLVVRFRATTPLYIIGALGGLVGALGLILWNRPELAWLWVSLFGLVGLLFPLALVLISIRAREPETAVALSGFVQSIGYTVAAIFPVLLGVLHTATGGWQVPLWVLAIMLVLSIPAGVIVGRPRTVEADWERRHGRRW